MVEKSNDIKSFTGLYINKKTKELLKEKSDKSYMTVSQYIRMLVEKDLGIKK